MAEIGTWENGGSKQVGVNREGIKQGFMDCSSLVVRSLPWSELVILQRPRPVAQSVASLTADPWVGSLILSGPILSWRLIMK